jgi:hypothetical protein
MSPSKMALAVTAGRRAVLAATVALVSFSAAAVRARSADSHTGTVQGRLATDSGGQATDETKVFVQGRKPVVVRDGRFSLPALPSKYDLWVTTTNQAFDVYQGLRSRTIRVAPFNAKEPDKPRKAKIQGLLHGDFPFPIRENAGLSVHFFSDRVSQGWSANPVEWSYGVSAGPRFGRMQLAWRGDAVVTGQLVAFAQIVVPKKLDLVEAAVATAPLTIRDGQEAGQEMRLQKVPIGKIAGKVSVEGKDMVREIFFSYRLPNQRDIIPLKHCPVQETYDCALPDLGVLGGDYCGFIQYDFYRGNGRGNTRLCGGKIGMTDFSFKVGSAPNIHTEHVGGRRAQLSWTDSQQGVYRVELRPDYEAGPLPHFTIYTTETSLTWPDFEALGLKFPAGIKYTCNVTRMPSIVSVDDLVSDARPPRAESSQEASSGDFEVTLTEAP